MDHGILWWSRRERIERLVKLEGIEHLRALDGKPVGAGAPGPVYRRIYAAFKATQREFSTELPA